MPRFTRVLFALIAALLLLPLSGCEDKLTTENYDQIKTGMPMHEVEKLLGGKGEMVERGGMGISGGGIASGSSNNWSRGIGLLRFTVR